MNTTDVKTKEFIDTVDMEDNSGNSITDIQSIFMLCAML